MKMKIKERIKGKRKKSGILKMKNVKVLTTTCCAAKDDLLVAEENKRFGFYNFTLDRNLLEMFTF